MPTRHSRLFIAAAALALCAIGMSLAACSTSRPAASAPALTSDQVAALVASPDRSEADRVNDQRRKPQDMLLFIGVRPGMVALDLSAAGGYTTELLARAAGPSGRVYGQNPPRSGTAPGPAQPEGGMAPAAGAPRPAPGGLAGRAARLQGGHIVVVTQPFEQPVPPEVAAGGLDLVTIMFNYHDLGHMGVDRAQMNRAVFAALKPGGLYVIADHSGRPGTGITESGTLHRIEESFLRSEVEQAGFKFAGEGFFLRNPNDPRDRNTPEPPMPKDEFVLKFVKP
jgi:predicted methyltransferase